MQYGCRVVANETCSGNLVQCHICRNYSEGWGRVAPREIITLALLSAIWASEMKELAKIYTGSRNRSPAIMQVQ